MSSDTDPALTYPEIEAAWQRLSPHLVATPVTHSHTLSDLCGVTALFKLENLQMTGSFKERGALNRLLALDDDEKRRGVIAASAGNHAQALAYHARRLGISARIVMPAYSPLVKIRSTEHWGADVTLVGETFDDAFRASQQIVAEENRIYVHPFDDPLVIEGQATLGIDILDHPLCRELDAIVVPVGGGGLIHGIAACVKARQPRVQVIGVEEATCAGMMQSRAAGHVVELPTAPVIADGIAVRRVAARNLDAVRRLVDDLVTVDSDEIANAIMLMLEIEKLVIEGAAAATLAALINNKLPSLRGKRVLCVLSGGNIDVNLLSKIINRGMAFDGRITRIESVLLDRPGALERLLGVFRESGANILEVQHHRFSARAPIGQIGITITAETRDNEHVQRLRDALTSRGYWLAS